MTRFMLAAAIALLVAATVNAGPAVEKAKEAYKPSEPDGTTNMIIDIYTNGTMRASYWVTLHAEPEAGQYWVFKTTTDFGGGKQESLTAWNIARVDGDTVIVENDPGQGYVLAYEVDKKKKLEDGGNVTKAWIGKPGQVGKEVKVMEAPKAAEAGDPKPAQPKYETTKEEFKDLKLAGGTWSGTKASVKFDDVTSTSWLSDKGWFGGLIKSEMKYAGGSYSGALEQFGDDAKPWLKWEDAKPEEKTPEKKPESKPEEKAPEKKPEDK